MGWLIQPKVLTSAALGVLSRNQLVVAFVDGSASIPAGRGGIGLVLKFGHYTVEVAEPVRSPANSHYSELKAIERAVDLFPAETPMIIKTDCQNLVRIFDGTSQPKKLLADIERIKQKITRDNIELRFILSKKKSPYPHPHKRADRLAAQARLEGRKMFRIHAV